MLYCGSMQWSSCRSLSDEQVVLFEFEAHEATVNGIPLGDFADWADEPVRPPENKQTNKQTNNAKPTP